MRTLLFDELCGRAAADIFGQQQFLLIGTRLVRIRKKTVGVVEAAALNRENNKGVPGAGVFEIGAREVRAAIRMRMEDTDQVKLAFARSRIRCKEISGTDFVPRVLLASEAIVQWPLGKRTRRGTAWPETVRQEFPTLTA
jgi:hypothetical protein